jgi:polypeptide N-acetylgalactosaminyltransferase
LSFVQIRNQGKNNICIDSQEVADRDKSIIGYPCHGQGGNQYFLLSKVFEIRREEKCLDYINAKQKEPGQIRSMNCHGQKGNQMWFYEVEQRSLQ